MVHTTAQSKEMMVMMRVPKPAERKTDSAEHLLLILILFLVLVFLLSLAGRLNDGGRDAVEVALTVLGNAAAAVVGLLEHADLLKRLADLALNRGRSIRVVRWAVAATVAAAVQLGQGADTDVFPEVDVSCDRGCSFGGGGVREGKGTICDESRRRGCDTEG